MARLINESLEMDKTPRKVCFTIKKKKKKSAAVSIVFTILCGVIVVFFVCMFSYMKSERSSGDEEYDRSMSEKSEEEEEEYEEADMSVLSNLDNYQLCFKYLQVLYIQHGFINLKLCLVLLFIH